MADKKVGIKTGKQTQAGRDVYVTKHIIEVMRTIPFLASDVAKKIRGE